MWGCGACLLASYADKTEPVELLGGSLLALPGIHNALLQMCKVRIMLCALIVTTSAR